uniref:Cathepsin B-like cysteine protease n=1 Tax=Callosobruchus maculatus TaxID=64391 RepID=Q5VJM8_CALMS|nr:cathepsin B-like cysteine protease [Callosobruchus maculatus]
MKLAFIALAAVVSCTFAQPELDFLSDEYIEQLNSKNLPWKAGRNFERDTSLYNIQRLLSVGTINPPSEFETIFHEDDGKDLPEEFDARKQWSKCESIKEIRDQSGCGSCWAVSSASVMSDRICIQSDQKNQLRISAADMIECCESCTFSVDGCHGGIPSFTFTEWKDSGFVSGGEYNSTNGCMSYPLPRCNPSCKTLYDAPTCKKECDKGSPLKYEEDKHYAKQAYRIMSKVERQIQLEIIKNGPVVASFTVYADFIHYLSGVYKFDGESKLLGGHAVRIIGWGIENGTYPYWLVSNSWNERWGDQGLFKIWRGKNECGIEEEITAGLPR